MKNTSKQIFFLDFLIDFFYVEKICHETFQKTCFREKKNNHIFGRQRQGLSPPNTES